jgi:hypothetical protein
MNSLSDFAFKLNLRHYTMEPYVSHAVFSVDGSVLVTVDRRSERPMPGLEGGAVGGSVGAMGAGAAAQPEETLRIWERRLVAAAGEGEDEDGGEAEAAAAVPGPGGFVCVCVCDAPHGRVAPSDCRSRLNPCPPVLELHCVR